MSSRVLRKILEKNDSVHNADHLQTCDGFNGLSSEIGDESENNSDLDHGKPYLGSSIFAQIKLEVDIDNTQSPNVTYETSPDDVALQKSTRKKKRKNKVKKMETVNDSSNPDEVIRPPVPTETRKVDVLRVNVKMLDHVDELRRMFGSSIVDSSTINCRSKRRIKRGLLVRSKHTWPPAVRVGLSMENLGNGLYSFVHSKEYRIVQGKFYQALESMDPNNISAILYENPYHIDSLLQLSCIMLQQDNSSLATDLLERALHAFQMAFHVSFNPLSVSCRLDYKTQVNRGLFVALFRYLTIIGDHGCNRSALEYCKLLLSFDPENDPLAVILVIDRYAIFSRQYDFLIKFYDQFNDARNLYLLPNFALSIPLAHKLSQTMNANKGTTEIPTYNVDLGLQDALIMFPGFLTRLLKHTKLGGVNNLGGSHLFGADMEKSESTSLGCLLNLYVARMHSIWTSNVVLPWLEKNVEIVLGLVERKRQSNDAEQFTVDARLEEYSIRRQSLYPSFPKNILRHLILAEVPEAPPTLPKTLINTPIYEFDPLPPKDSVDIYNPSEARRQQSQHSGDDFLNSLISSFLPSYPIQQAMNELGVPGPSNDNQVNNEGATATENSFGSSVQSAIEGFTTQLRQILVSINFQQITEDAEEHNSDFSDQ